MSRRANLLLRFCAITFLGVSVLGLIGAQLIPEVAGVTEAVSVEPRSTIRLPELPEGSTIFDPAGNRVGALRGTENRIVVPLSEMSEEFVDTVLAVEDADFYEHDGVSARSVLRAIKANSEAGGVEQGGSTITQQLVKLNLVGNEQTIQRKLKEASLAVQLEDQLCGSGATKKQCKDIILQQYLNQVYLGQGAYGAEAAARTYFDKPASELNYADAALLASLIQNPSNYDPITNPELAERRRSVALSRMLDEGLIDEKQAAFIEEVPLPTQVYGRTAARATQSLSYVERKIRDELLEAEWLAPTVEQRRYLIFNGGLRITSTIDPRAQALAEASTSQNPIGRTDPQSAVALAAVEPSSGAVRAIVGEVERNGVPIEIGDPVRGARSGDGGFSAGSAFKPFTLVAALEQGYTIRDNIRGDPAPTEQKKDWGVEPLSRSYPTGCPTKGSQPLANHLRSSNNCAFMRLQSAVGYDAVRDTAIRMGLEPGPLDPGHVRPPCFTIGCGALVTPLDMAGAYATIINDGRRNPTHFVERVTDRDGNVLFQYEPVNEQVISVQSARQAVSAMEGVITGGTCTRCRLPNGQPAAGKTGTTEVGAGANVGAWFVGFTPTCRPRCGSGTRWTSAAGCGATPRAAGPLGWSGSGSWPTTWPVPRCCPYPNPTR
ncbi:MAG: transglycosylase domain-containing protein [Microthrixaceae bacterium]